MMSESHRLFVASGLLIGVLALAALGLRFGNRESSAKETDGRIDTAVLPAARPVTADTPPDDARNAGIERVLQAVHDSLQRGDLASAHLLLDAVLTMRANEPQALLLQQELAAREQQAQAASVDDQRPEKSHMHARTSTKATLTRPGKSHRLTDTPDDDAAAADAVPPSIALRADSAKHDDAIDTTPGADALVTASPRSSAPPEVATAPATQTAATAVEPADKPVEPAAPSVAQSTAPPAPSPAAAAGATPKTRAEVRDELSRARKNGTMSRFGNPDPYGPGGSPSYNAQPSIRTW